MTSETGMEFADLPADDMLGLSISPAGRGATNKYPFVQQLLDSGLLQKPLFTVYLAADPEAE
ncbi:hypothetical protein AAVH_35223, partial [Aphelenchoides avenae]